MCDNGDYKNKFKVFKRLTTLLYLSELSHYTIPINNQKDSGSISLGLSLITFLMHYILGY